MLVSANFDDSIDRTTLLTELDDILDTEEPMKASNIGGYHSPGYTLDTNPSGKPTFDKLATLARDFVHAELEELEWKFKPLNTYYWFMCNQFNNYNSVHNHGRVDFIGVYYPKLPENCGNMTVLRTDAISYSSLFSRNSQVSFEIEPVEGRFFLLPGHLWHYVESNVSQDPRYSIAFNFSE